MKKKRIILLFIFVNTISYSQNKHNSFDTIYYYSPIKDVNFRVSPSIKSNVIKILTINDTVKILDSISNWYKLKNNENNIGFVSKSLINKKFYFINKTNTPFRENLFNAKFFNYLAFIFLLILIYIIINLKRKIIKLIKDLEKFKPIISLENEIKDLENIKEKFIKDYKIEKKELESKYQNGKIIYNELKKKISIFNNQNELIESGIYDPIFDFNTTEEFKENITLNRTLQKKLIKEKTACFCPTEWTVQGSVREGKKMINKNIRLTLRAFNGECESLISKVRWNNINNIELRILKSFEMINKFNETMNIFISQDFLDLKINELKLSHEFNLKKYNEKEEQRKVRALIREEEKARRDFEKAKKEAELEQKVFAKALEKAKKDLGLVSGVKLLKLQEKIKLLESDIEFSKQKSERALSMAQQTRRGHVYVVSNLGSFGKNIYKIGMTRRLDPFDRVKELGDASVPFLFDMHAMIYTEDAPNLESLLHNKFNDRRVNKVNFRKEYFNVTLDEIETCINENFEGEYEIIKNIEAREYRETIQLLNKIEKKTESKDDKNNEYPEKLF